MDDVFLDLLGQPRRRQQIVQETQHALDLKRGHGIQRVRLCEPVSESYGERPRGFLVHGVLSESSVTNLYDATLVLPDA